MDDARILNSVAQKGKQVAIIGAGLVGLETAEALHALGLKVTVIEFLNQVLPAMIDAEMGEILQEKMKSVGVVLKLGTAAKEVTNTHVRVAERESGEEEDVPADLVLVATGVRANTDLAAKAGITLGERGGILCDDRMMTNVKNVYAAGDCAEVHDLVTGQTVVSGRGNIALRQGEVAGQNAAGGHARFPGVVMARTTTLFGLEIAAVGPTTVSAKKANLSVLAGKFAGKPTSDYYPSDEIVTVRVLADKETGRFLGGQAIGPCAHQRVNVLSATLVAKMTIEQVARLETCYAPPVAPIREPFLLAAQIVYLRYDRLKQKREKAK